MAEAEDGKRDRAGKFLFPNNVDPSLPPPTGPWDALRAQDELGGNRDPSKIHARLWDVFKFCKNFGKNLQMCTFC